ncbi:MAG TPA: Kazal-type serine protease inhibitor [Cryomorphaceae bacterium]|nr:Kazal-type serine protease inhibitor [Cryomorphaceae bacterium]
MKKITFFCLLLIFTASCEKDTGCIDESQIIDAACPTNFDPVCGCNGETYGNDCEAEREGVTSWTDGEC